MPGIPARVRKKTPWQVRLDYLESLSLDAIVDEINRERFSNLLSRLAAPSAHEKAKMVRLLKLYESDQLHELPTDQRANPVRMRRLLIGLHRTCGPHLSCVIEIKRLASNSTLTPATCERAVRDVVEGHLVIADRERERPKRFGGQGPSSYQIVWSTIADLALSQGVQASLFDRSPIGLVAGLPPPRAGALPHCAGALPHCAGALPHKPRANARADVLPELLFETSSPSGSEPSLSSPRATPSANAAGDRSAQSQGEKKDFHSDGREGSWSEAAARLQRYGVYFSLNALKAARRHGWSIDQVHELVGACEAKREGPAYGWPPGLVCRHLQLAPAGAPIALPLSEAFVRARRDRAVALQAARQQPAPLGESAVQSIEAEFGPHLDALSPAEREELEAAVRAANPVFTEAVRKRFQIAFRDKLLRELKRRAEATNQQAQ